MATPSEQILFFAAWFEDRTTVRRITVPVRMQVRLRVPGSRTAGPVPGSGVGGGGHGGSGVGGRGSGVGGGGWGVGGQGYESLTFSVYQFFDAGSLAVVSAVTIGGLQL